MSKDWTRDLDSVRRQNIKLLKEREAYRDTVRGLREKERDYQRRLEELWSVCTDCRLWLASILSVAEGDNWKDLPTEVHTLVTMYLTKKDQERPPESKWRKICRLLFRAK